MGNLATIVASTVIAAAIVAGCSSQPNTAPSPSTPPPEASPSPSPSLTVTEVPPLTGSGVEGLSTSQMDALTDMAGFVPAISEVPEFTVLFATSTEPALNPGSDYALRMLMASSGLAGYQVDGWSAVTSETATGSVSNPQKGDVTVYPGLSGNAWQVSLATPTQSNCVTLPSEPGGAVTVTDGLCPEGSQDAALKALTAIVDAAFAEENTSQPSPEQPPAGEATPALE